MTKLNLPHTTLYAKNWYKRSEDIIEDLSNCLDADGYIPFTKRDVFSILLSKLKNINYLTPDKFIQAIRESSPSECWKCGYYTNECTWIEENEYPKYDYHLAFIYWCLSEISMMDKDQCEITLPSNKVLPVPKGNIKKMKEILN